ncbi:MAG: hypothetical protein P9X24_00990 [Candidatus Hatepunaea meridiana]|nr:hypothetical protein [Candidatus Hatepunaea meridiana]
MLKSVEAIIYHDGRIRLLEAIRLRTSRKAIVTILEEEVGIPKVDEITLVSEEALAEDWNKPEEDKAWSHLQPEQ